MIYHRVGRSGLSVSAISLGGWLTFGGTVDARLTGEIVHAAVAQGINFLDLADIYARGEAESATGTAIKGLDRSKLVISSKAFWPMSDDPNDRGLSRKHLFESVDKSLKRLGTDYLDIYFCHRYDDNTPLEETVRAMDDLIRAGKVLYWGTSVWTPRQLRDAHAVAVRYNAYPPAVEQPRYNLLDRTIEADVVPAARELGMGLVVWSPLAQGILTGKYNAGRPAGSRGADSKWLDRELTDDNIARVRKLSALASENGYTPAQLALAWLCRRPGVSSVITGATSPRQLEENVGAAEKSPSDGLMAAIDQLFAV